MSPTPPQGTVLVTGASGFIGHHLCARLADAGTPVIAVDRAPSPSLASGVVFEQADIRDRKAMDAIVAEHKPTHGVHLAALVGDWGPRADYHAVNVEGTRNVLGALVEGGVTRALHLSSIASMGHHPGEGADETHPPCGGGDAYSDTKGLGELEAVALQRAGAPVVVIRPGDVYGPGSVPWVIRPVDLLRQRRLFLVGGGQGTIAPVYVDNLIDGILLGLTHPDALGEVFIVTDGDHKITFGEYFSLLADAVKLPRPSLSLPVSLALAVAWGYEMAARLTGRAPSVTRTAVHFILREGSYSTDKARRVLGYSPRFNLTDGMQAIAEAYAREG